jgi:predicted metal-dependent peptidase
MSDEDFESQAQALADLMEAQSHQWFIKPGEEGKPTDETCDSSHLNAEELEASATLLDEAGKQLIQAAIRDHEKSRGTVPRELRMALDAMLEESTVPWTTLLKSMVVARMLAAKKSTMTRPHKRRQILWFFNEETQLIERFETPLPQYPGYNRDRTYVALFAIDTSGSMSLPDIAEGLSEMQGILTAYADAHLIVVQCDTQISSVDIVGPDIDVDEYVQTIGRTSYGGTTFDAPFQLARYIRGEGHAPRVPRTEETLRKLAKYKTVDLLIYHTDGYAPMPSPHIRPTCPTIWLCTENATTDRMSFGHILRRN